MYPHEKSLIIIFLIFFLLPAKEPKDRGVYLLLILSFTLPEGLRLLYNMETSE